MAGQRDGSRLFFPGFILENRSTPYATDRPPARSEAHPTWLERPHSSLPRPVDRSDCQFWDLTLSDAFCLILECVVIQ